jgi:hypothetical protein
MDFKTIALAQQDFFTRLKALQGTTITAKNFSDTESAVNAFNKEKDETIATSFNRGVEAKKTFNATWKTFVDANGGAWAMSEFLPIKSAFETLDVSAQEVYTQALQVRAYGDEANLKLASALQSAYSNPDGIMEDDRKEIMAMATAMSKMNETLSRLAKKYAEKLRDGKAQAP